jgi:hypothetical protein
MELNLTVTPENFDPDSTEWVSICNHLRHSLGEDENLVLSAPKPDLVPKNAKGEPITVGAFVIAVASAPAVVQLFRSLNDWIKNLGSRKVKIAIQSQGHKITAEATGFAMSDVENLVKTMSQAR